MDLVAVFIVTLAGWELLRPGVKRACRWLGTRLGGYLARREATLAELMQRERVECTVDGCAGFAVACRQHSEPITRCDYPDCITPPAYTVRLAEALVELALCLRHSSTADPGHRAELERLERRKRRQMMVAPSAPRRQCARSGCDATAPGPSTECLRHIVECEAKGCDRSSTGRAGPKGPLACPTHGGPRRQAREA